jgi:hypothetical protein
MSLQGVATNVTPPGMPGAAQPAANGVRPAGGPVQNPPVVQASGNKYPTPTPAPVNQPNQQIDAKKATALKLIVAVVMFAMIIAVWWSLQPKDGAH